MVDDFSDGEECNVAIPGFGGRMEVLEDPSGRRRWPEALKGRIVAESFAPGARVCDVARRYRVTEQQLTTWRRAAREGLLALPGKAVGADGLGLVSVEVEAPDETPDEAAPTAGRSDRIEIVAGSVLVRLPAATAASRVMEIAVAVGARL